MRDILTAPKSTLMYQCLPLFNNLYKCLPVGGIKKSEDVSKAQRRLREFLAYKNRFIYKSAEESIKQAIADPSIVKDPEEPFFVSFWFFITGSGRKLNVFILQKSGPMQNGLFLEAVAGVWIYRKLYKDYWNADNITPEFIALVACFVSFFFFFF